MTIYCSKSEFDVNDVITGRRYTEPMNVTYRVTMDVRNGANNNVNNVNVEMPTNGNIIMTNDVNNINNNGVDNGERNCIQMVGTMNRFKVQRTNRRNSIDDIISMIDNVVNEIIRCYKERNLTIKHHPIVYFEYKGWKLNVKISNNEMKYNSLFAKNINILNNIAFEDVLTMVNKDVKSDLYTLLSQKCKFNKGKFLLKCFMTERIECMFTSDCVAEWLLLIVNEKNDNLLDIPTESVLMVNDEMIVKGLNTLLREGDMSEKEEK